MSDGGPKGASGAPTGSGPVIEIIAGDPTPEESAAVIAVVVELLSDDGERDADPHIDVARWNSGRSRLRRPVFPGRGEWVAAVRS